MSYVFIHFPVCCHIGYLRGGDTLRLLHSHSDACLTVPSPELGEEFQRSVLNTNLHWKMFLSGHPVSYF